MMPAGTLLIPMETVLASFVAVLLYCTAGFLLAYTLYRRGRGPLPPVGRLILVATATVLHALVLYNNIVTDQGLNLGFFNAVSLFSWLIAVLVLITSLSTATENLGIAIFPLAGLALGLELAFPGQHVLAQDVSAALQTHIIISILAYGMLSLATAQAILLSIQNRHLRTRHPGGFIRALPPLQTMEDLLFRMLTVGFVLQSLSLISGWIFLENIFAQHMVHKTLLSIIAWLVFAILLWGRWYFGWRGKTAVRWTLSGAGVLMLAYFGSKLVLELVLHR